MLKKVLIVSALFQLQPCFSDLKPQDQISKDLDFMVEFSKNHEAIISELKFIDVENHIILYKDQRFVKFERAEVSQIDNDESDSVKQDFISTQGPAQSLVFSYGSHEEDIMVHAIEDQEDDEEFVDNNDSENDNEIKKTDNGTAYEILDSEV